MNRVFLMGRLTRDPDVRYSQGQNQTAIARYSLAVDRRFRRDGDPEADFINCVAFGKQAEFAERFLRKGIKMVVEGRIQTGSYTNRDGNKVYTTDVIVESQEFAESKAANDRVREQAPAQQGAPAGAPQQQGYTQAPQQPAQGFAQPTVMQPNGEDDLPF